uniref:Uncharacterized protein n=1 Tax=Arundo donax TaxID=35708 RepID=A0A0A9ANC6_ARUDO
MFNNTAFRSLLSQMVLLPRIYPPGARLRSPSVRQGTSPSTTVGRGQRGIGVIDFNIALEEETSPATTVS